MVQSIFEEMGGRYERQGEYILPCLTIPPEKEQSIDLFGRRHLDYLREYRKITYTNLLTSGRLNAYTSAGYMLRIDCWEAEKNLKTTPGSDCALTSLAVDEPLEYARLYLDGNLQMWVNAEDSLEI